MAMIQNPETGEWEEDGIDSTALSPSANKTGPGLAGLPDTSTAPTGPINWTDTSGIFGKAGQGYSDFRYNDQNDYKTWTDPKVIQVDNGINKATGLPFTRADQGFGDYTTRADANGRAEAARQAAESGKGGLFGNPILDFAAQAAAAYFGGPLGAGLYGTAASGGDIGKGLMAAGMTYAGGQMTGTGSGAAGGSWYSPSGDLSSMFSGGDTGGLYGLELGGEGVGAALPNSIGGDYWSNVTDSFSGIGGTGSNIAPIANTIEQGLNTAALNTSNVGSLSNMQGDPLSNYNWNPDAVGTSSGPVSTPNNLENITRDYGIQSPNTTPYTPDYGNMQDADNAVNFAKADGAQGYGIEATGSTPGMDTLGSTNKLQSYLNTLKGGGMSPWDALTQPIGGGKRGLFSAPSPLGMAGRGLSALFDMNSNKDAMRLLEEQRARSNEMGDSNAARGQAANSMWTENFQNPQAGFDNYMAGPGRLLRDQAVAKMAAGGNRRQLGGKLQSDMFSNYLANQNSRGNALYQGFANNPNQGGDSLATALAGMERNKYAPIGQAISNIDRGFTLSDIFGNA